MDLRHAADLIEWDERVYMPPGGATVHGEMSAALRRLAHEKFTSSDVGDASRPPASDVAARRSGSTDAARMVAVTARDYDKATRVPADFVAEHATVVSAAQHAWAEARARSDFARFAPHLEKVIDLKRRYVDVLSAGGSPVRRAARRLRAGHEDGGRAARLFDSLRRARSRSSRRSAARPAPPDGFMTADVRRRRPLALCRRRDHGVRLRLDARAAGQVGSSVRDRDRRGRRAHHDALGRGTAARPCCSGRCTKPGTRCTSRASSVAHQRTLLEGGASLGVHESQSRLWENIVGRSRPFWDHFFPRLQARVSSAAGAASRPTTFYRGDQSGAADVHSRRGRRSDLQPAHHAARRARARVDRRLAERVADLPEAWNARMQEYLGLTPPDDAKGVLQDIHWSAGLFGYFATYTLGQRDCRTAVGAIRRGSPAARC